MNCGPDSSHFSGTSWSLSVYIRISNAPNFDNNILNSLSSLYHNWFVLNHQKLGHEITDTKLLTRGIEKRQKRYRCCYLSDHISNLILDILQRLFFWFAE